MGDVSLELSRLARDGSAKMDADLIAISRRVKFLEGRIERLCQALTVCANHADDWQRVVNVSVEALDDKEQQDG